MEAKVPKQVSFWDHSCVQSVSGLIGEEHRAKATTSRQTQHNRSTVESLDLILHWHKKLQWHYKTTAEANSTLHGTYSHRESENTCPHSGNKDTNSSCRSAASVEIIRNTVASNLLFRGICFPGKCTWTCSKRTSWSRNSNTVKTDHHLWNFRIIRTEETELDTLMYPNSGKKNVWSDNEGKRDDYLTIRKKSVFISFQFS